MTRPGGRFEKPQRPLPLVREVQLRAVPSKGIAAMISGARPLVLVRGFSDTIIVGHPPGPPAPTEMTLITSASGSRVLASTTIPCTAPVPAVGAGTVWARVTGTSVARSKRAAEAAWRYPLLPGLLIHPSAGSIHFQGRWPGAGGRLGHAAVVARGGRLG